MDCILEIEKLYLIKEQKYIKQGIVINEKLAEILLKETIRQYRFMNYINTETKKICSLTTE